MTCLQEVAEAMDFQGVGAVRIAQFMSAASDRRCTGTCTLSDNDAVQQACVGGTLSLKAFADLLTHENLAVRPEALIDMICSAGLPVKEGSVRLQDLEVRLHASKDQSQRDYEDLQQV